MKNNSEQVLFEGTVISARATYTTDPPSEIIDINYSVKPYDVVEIEYDEWGYKWEKNMGKQDKGWIQLCLPVFNGLKAGDKIKVIKV